MRVIRVGLPALTGLVVIFIAVQSIGGGLGEPNASLLDAVHTWLLPISVGVGLLLAALAISRRTRSGYLLGIGVAVVMVLAGIAVVVIEVPYLADGGLGGAIATGVLVVVAIWILVWVVYGLGTSRARASFAAEWQPVDRQFGIVIGSLAVFATAAFFALGFAQSQEVASATASQAQVDALVAGTTVAARVVDATYSSPTDGTSAPQVKTLTLELTFATDPAYALAQVPSICLTDAVTARDPGFKPGAYCWGTTGPALELTDGFRDLTMSARTVRLEIDRGASLCAFGAGAWDGQVEITPLVAGANAGAPSQTYNLQTSFVLESAAAPPPSGTAEASACIASFVSP